MRHWSIDPAWADPHVAFLANNDPTGTPAGGCFEITIGTDPQLWAAYNPHGARTPTTRTHLLDPGYLVVEVANLQSSIMDAAGGTDLDPTHGPSALDLKTTFETGTLTGYIPTPTQANFIASTKMIEGEKAITSGTPFEVLAGVVTTIGFFLSTSVDAVGRVVGEIKTDGVGVELRLVRSSDGAVLTSTVFAPGDTLDVWQVMQFSTDQDPGRETETYILEGRLNAATSAAIRFVSMSLLEIA